MMYRQTGLVLRREPLQNTSFFVQLPSKCVNNKKEKLTTIPMNRNGLPPAREELQRIDYSSNTKPLEVSSSNAQTRNSTCTTNPTPIHLLETAGSDHAALVEFDIPLKYYFSSTSGDQNHSTTKPQIPSNQQEEAAKVEGEPNKSCRSSSFPSEEYIMKE